MPYPTIRLVQDWLRVRKQFVESRLCKVKLYVQAGTDPNSYLSTGICTDPHFTHSFRHPAAKSHIGPVSFPNAKECFLLQKTAYRRANGGSTAPSLHEVWGYHRDITHGVIVPHGAPKNRARLPFLTGSGPSLYSGKNASLSHLAEDGALGWKTSLSLMLLVCAGIGLSYASTM